MVPERFWSVLDSSEVVLVITTGAEGFPRARPMILVERDGSTLWFATSAGSRKVAEIGKDPRVTVLAFDRGDFNQVSLSGRAQVRGDQATKDRLWQEIWREEWPLGPSDPDYVLLCVASERGAYYFADSNEATDFPLPA